MREREGERARGSNQPCSTSPCALPRFSGQDTAEGFTGQHTAANHECESACALLFHLQVVGVGVCVCVWMGGCELCELDVALKSTARETNAHVLLSVSLSPPFSLQAKRQGRKRAKRPASASHLVLSVRFMTTLSALSPFPQVTGVSRQCYASLFEPSMPHTSTLFFPTLNPPKPLSLSFSLFLCVSLW